MPRLRIKQHVWSFLDGYDITDEDHHKVFKVSSVFFTWRSVLHIHSYATNERVIKIKRRFSCFCSEYDIYDGRDKKLATINQKVSCCAPKLRVRTYTKDHAVYTLRGDFLAWDFDIKKNDVVVGSVAKKVSLWRDSYGLDYKEGEDPALLTAFAIVIDQIYHPSDQ